MVISRQQVRTEGLLIGQKTKVTRKESGRIVVKEQLMLPVDTKHTFMSVKKRDSSNVSCNDDISFLGLNFSSNSTKEGSKLTPSTGKERSNSIMNSCNIDSESASKASCNLNLTDSETMQLRWLKVLENSIPEFDLDDVNTLLNDPSEGRQFAPEYSQCTYNEMLKSDNITGNYINEIDQSTIQFTEKDREHLMQFVHFLHKKKEYKVETLHLACALVDKYLAFLVRAKKYTEMPNLYHLAATCMLIAAKIEQPVTPSVKRMIALLPTNEQKRTSKQDICALEKKILTSFDFDLHYVGPISFLERYQRLLQID